MKADELKKQDDEASQFAMELLMPVQFVRDEIAKLKARKHPGEPDLGDDRTIKELAKIFQVPNSIMAIRIRLTPLHFSSNKAASK